MHTRDIDACSRTYTICYNSSQAYTHRKLTALIQTSTDDDDIDDDAYAVTATTLIRCLCKAERTLKNVINIINNRRNYFMKNEHKHFRF